MCLTKTEKEKARETLWWFMTSCLCVCLWVCVCLSEKVLQWCIYDTPFTSGGASCLSFFIPRSLMGLWWWWRDGPSPPALTPPWDEEGPPPRPPEECCTLRSLLLSTRICGRKDISTVWFHTSQLQVEGKYDQMHNHWWMGTLDLGPFLSSVSKESSRKLSLD